MKYTRTVMALLASLLFMVLVLAGCTTRNDKLDAQMQMAITALNQKDTDTLRQMLPAEGIDKKEFLSGLEQIYNNWEPCDPSEARLIQLNITKTTDQTITRGVYAVPGNDQYNCIQLVYVESEDGTSSLNGFHLGWAEKSSSFTADSPLGIIGIIFAIITSVIIIVTVIDIARKRPRKYGWYIVLALVTFFLSVNGIRFTAPLGAIIYWCIRSSLLQKKAEREAENAPMQEHDTVKDNEEEPKSDV